MATATKSVPFRKYVKTNEHGLPLLVHVSESMDDDIITGDVLKLIKLFERYELEYVCPETNRKRSVAVPPDMGGFKIVSELPSNHVYSSVREMALDFPQSVRVLKEIHVQKRMTFNRGHELVLKWIQAIGKTQFLVCQHVQSNTQLMLPFDLQGQFQRKNDDNRFTVKQLRSRMPVSVKRDLDSDEAPLSEPLLGIPADGTTCLSMITLVQVEHWSQPTTVQLCTGSGKKNMYLKLDRDIMVAAASVNEADSVATAGAAAAGDNYDEPYGHVQKLADVENDSYVVVCRDESGNKEKRITEGAHIVVVGHETKQGVILKGKTSYLLVPKDYDKETKFRMRGVEYTTPFDLWKSNYEGEVTATQHVKCPQGFQARIESIHQMDRIQLVKSLDQTELPKVLSDNKRDECKVVKVMRTFSQFNDHLGVICLDRDAKACFEEPPAIIGQHGLFNLLRYGNIPMDIALGDVSHLHSMNEGDRILICESPFKVLQEFTYSVTYVSGIDMQTQKPIGEISEIPDCYDIKVLSSKTRPKVKATTQLEKPTSGLFTLSSTEYYSLTGEPEYIEIIDTNAARDDPICHTYIGFNNKTLKSRPSMPTHPPPPLPPGSVNRKSYRPNPRTIPVQLQLPLQLEDQTFHNRLTALHETDTESVYVAPQRPPKSPNLTRRTVATQPSSSESMMSLRPVPRPRTPNSKSLNAPRTIFTKESPTREYKSAYHPVPRPRESLKNKTSYGDESFEDKNEDTLPPPNTPPADKGITSYTADQLAGMMRHLGFGFKALTNCVLNNINGQKLLDIFRRKKSDIDIMHELKLDKLSEVHCLQLFVNQTELAEALPVVTPPEDGIIRGLSVRELAGMMRHLEFKEQTIAMGLAQQIDGDRLCSMDSDTIKRDLALTESQHYALQHFIARSELYTSSE